MSHLFLLFIFQHNHKDTNLQREIEASLIFTVDLIKNFLITLLLNTCFVIHFCLVIDFLFTLLSNEILHLLQNLQLYLATYLCFICVILSGVKSTVQLMRINESKLEYVNGYYSEVVECQCGRGKYFLENHFRNGHFIGEPSLAVMSFHVQT